MNNPSSLRDATGHLAEQATASVDTAIRATQKLAEDTMDGLSHTSQQLRDKADAASSAARGYIKDEPVKAVLIAAATGAVLMGLLSLVSHTRQR
jgi:ElaB/YqjD/DUF883 family membrane-anchored ribosome-binding protein